MPDLFANMRVKKPKKFIQYKKLNPMGDSEITEHYTKYIEPVFEEDQNTSEKFWDFNNKIYEITEEKKKELLKFNIPISPSDYEWVIDIFEKTAINDQQCGIKALIEYFRKRAKPEVSQRVSDKTLEMIFDLSWKSQREQRKNRSFIREFWRY